jgi:hypothetical protein
MEEITIDIEALRRDLMNYFGSATPMFPQAYMDVIEVQNASANELVQIALRNGFRLEDYQIHSFGK